LSPSLYCYLDFVVFSLLMFNLTCYTPTVGHQIQYQGGPVKPCLHYTT
jgi:hypothetical protein